MRTRQLARSAGAGVAALALLGSLVACAAEDDPSSVPAERSTVPDGASSSAVPDDTVTSVTFRRSGGKTGGVVTRTFTAGEQPPDGFDAVEQTRLIRVAQHAADSGVRVPELPANTCCDRFLYTIVIGFADGTSATFTALDGEPTPAVFQDLLTQLS